MRGKRGSQERAKTIKYMCFCATSIVEYNEAIELRTDFRLLKVQFAKCLRSVGIHKQWLRFSRRSLILRNMQEHAIKIPLVLKLIPISFPPNLLLILKHINHSYRCIFKVLVLRTHSSALPKRAEQRRKQICFIEMALGIFPLR